MRARICFLILGLLFGIGAQICSQEIKVASWNIRDFASWNRNDFMLKIIAKIIQKYDIIALQEVRDVKVLKRTIDILRRSGYRYRYIVSHPVGNYRRFGNKIFGHYERYSFLYNTNVIKPISKAYVYNDRSGYFLRPPFFCRFRAGNFDFILVTSHIIYSAPKVVKRREIYGLRQVYYHLKQRYPYENDILFVGDFNLNPNEIWAWQPLSSISNMSNVFYLPNKSMISDSNLFDNIIFQPNFVREWTGEKGIYHFDHHIFYNNDRRARRVCSDHRPVWCTFFVHLSDDD